MASEDAWICRRADVARVLRLGTQLIYTGGALLVFEVVTREQRGWRGGARRVWLSGGGDSTEN